MSSDPHDSSGLGDLGSKGQVSSSLGSLGQSARKKKLNQTRGLLIGVGALMILLNVFDIVQIPDFVKKGMPAALVNLVYLIDGGFICLGAIFIVLGLLIHAHPVPVTILALVLFVGWYFITGLLLPLMFVQGIILKIIVVVALAKAIQTAVAYQKEEQEAARAAEMGI